MFVPRAHVYIGHAGRKRGWFSTPSQYNRRVQQKLKYYEYVRMPCLIPTFVGTIVGVLLILMGGFMCYVGYNPNIFVNDDSEANNSTLVNSTDPSASSIVQPHWKYPGLRSLAYIGPIFMGIGFFVMMVAVVLYCEIKEKYVNHVLPGKNIRNWKKDELYDMIIEEFRKNYFRGIEVPLRDMKKNSAVEKDFPTLCKALSISTPAILITPEIQPAKWSHPHEIPTTPVPRLKPRRASRLRDHDSWMKTSSMPNIRRKSLCREAVHKGTGSRQHYNKLSKSYEHPNKDTLTITPDVAVDTTGVDNPAFRSSPTEKQKLTDIKFTFTVDSPEVSSGEHLTEVIVHNAASSEKTIDDEHLALQSLSGSDTRGFTLRRQKDDISDNDESIKHFSECDSKLQDDLDDVFLHFDSDDEEQKHKNEITRVRSLYNFTDSNSTDSGVKLDMNKKGLYKTYITVFRSDSRLDKLKHDDDENMSVDSLCLTDEIMKNFETST